MKTHELRQIIKTTIREFLNEQRNINEIFGWSKKEKESNLPIFTRETGVSKITNLKDLEEFIKFTIPERYYDIQYHDQLKYFEINTNDFYSRKSGKVRVGGENGKIKIYIHDTHRGDSKEKLFDYYEISGMEEYLKKIVSYQLPSIGLK